MELTSNAVVTPALRITDLDLEILNCVLQSVPNLYDLAVTSRGFLALVINCTCYNFRQLSRYGLQTGDFKSNNFVAFYARVVARSVLDPVSYLNPIPTTYSTLTGALIRDFAAFPSSSSYDKSIAQTLTAHMYSLEFADPEDSLDGVIPVTTLPPLSDRITADTLAASPFILGLYGGVRFHIVDAFHAIPHSRYSSAASLEFGTQTVLNSFFNLIRPDMTPIDVLARHIIYHSVNSAGVEFLHHHPGISALNGPILVPLMHAYLYHMGATKFIEQNWARRALDQALAGGNAQWMTAVEDIYPVEECFVSFSDYEPLTEITVVADTGEIVAASTALSRNQIFYHDLYRYRERFSYNVAKVTDAIGEFIYGATGVRPRIVSPHVIIDCDAGRYILTPFSCFNGNYYYILGGELRSVSPATFCT